MRWLLALVLVAGCESDVRKPMTGDAASSDVDAATDGNSIDAGIDATPLTLDCASYCTAIMAACTGANAQYGSMANCTATCNTIANAGAVTNTMGNTLGCRIYHTELARSTPATHCSHAGPSGGGACGTTCQAVCDQIEELCTNLPANNDWNNCASQCASLTASNSLSTAWRPE